MSKKVLIILAIGIIVILAAFIIHKFEVEKVLEDAELEPVVKPKKTKVVPVVPVTPGNNETGKVNDSDETQIS